jgi:hypothetical protein
LTHSKFLLEVVVDVDTAYSMSRVFHHVSSEMKVAIFETFPVFALFKDEGILFQSSTFLLEKKCLLSV